MKLTNNILRNEASDLPEGGTAVATAPTVASRPVITVVAKGQALQEAIKTILERTNKTALFKVTDKIGESAPGSTIASVGLSPFYMGSEPVLVRSLGTKITQDPAERAANWEVIRDEDSTIEDILTVLGNPETYCVIPGRALTAMRSEIAERRVAIAEAETIEEKLALTTAAFKYLLGQIPMK